MNVGERCMIPYFDFSRTITRPPQEEKYMPQSQLFVALSAAVDRTISQQQFPGILYSWWSLLFTVNKIRMMSSPVGRLSLHIFFKIQYNITGQNKPISNALEASPPIPNSNPDASESTPLAKISWQWVKWMANIIPTNSCFFLLPCYFRQPSHLLIHGYSIILCNQWQNDNQFPLQIILSIQPDDTLKDMQFFYKRRPNCFLSEHIHWSKYTHFQWYWILHFAIDLYTLTKETKYIKN